MLTLAIDTATKVCTIALCRDKEILAEYTINMGMTHSEGLLPQLDQLLQRTGVQKQDIELLAVSMGPGSFTGLRIGLATAEAMAYSWQCCLHGVDTLKAMAYNIQLEGRVLSPVLDAQKGNFYQALYEWRNGELVELAPVEVVSAEKLRCREPLRCFWESAPSLRKTVCLILSAWHPKHCVCLKAALLLWLPWQNLMQKTIRKFLAWSHTISEDRRLRNCGRRSTSNNKLQSNDGSGYSGFGCHRGTILL